MIEGLTKERIDVFTEEKEQVEALLHDRAKEILEKAKSANVPTNIISTDGIDISSYDNCFRLTDNWSYRGEEHTDYSICFPMDALYSDEVLDRFLDEKVKEQQKTIQRKQDKEREEYERLKKKFEKS